MDAVDWQQRFVLRRFKGFRRILSRFEKLDVMFIGFIHFTLIIETFHSVNTPWRMGEPPTLKTVSSRRENYENDR